MGYSTRYKLTTDCHDYDKRLHFHERLMSISEASFALEIKVQGLNYNTKEKCTWYDHVMDLCKISLEFPGVTLNLSGEGEQQGDLWRKVFLDGRFKLIRPRIQWPEQEDVDLMTWQEIDMRQG